MFRIYVIFGIIICVIFAYACLRGWQIIDPEATAASKPKGPGQYHK